MSSLPGLDLESFLTWNYDLTVEDQPEANFSLGMAVMLGRIQPRKHLTSAEFATVVAMFEEHRKVVEMKLLEFEEDNMSWRDYACYTFDFIPDELYDQADAHIKALMEAKNANTPQTGG